MHKLLQSWDQKSLANYLNQFSPGKWARETINRWIKGKASPSFTHHEYQHLLDLLPETSVTPESAAFRFVDLFAGIGGIRRGFESVGGLCVFTSEWNKFAQRTYKANYHCDPEHHVFNSDIRSVTLSQQQGISEQQAYQHINREVPDHDVLLAGFPCQPFSLAGVSKKNALGRVHGFECQTQGTLFFDVARIIKAKQPVAFVLENVKNLKSHDGGKTFEVILQTLDELGYEVADKQYQGKQDPKIIDAQHFLPQHRERIVLVGFRKDLNVHQGFSLTDIARFFPKQSVSLGSLLSEVVDSKYVLTPKLWQYLFTYAQKHKAKGNGFGFGLVNNNSVARTLSARYYKDGSEILVDRGWDFNRSFEEQLESGNRPRRLTPEECARLMGFSKPGENQFKIPVSDTQAYKQFGNSVVVPVFEAVAKLMEPRILNAVQIAKSANVA
ncbi:cytosine-specific methyltransferase [Planctobacterium marinum]|uniref:Cytosine-specific methyltransferase n=1 Tax=Planctobacterium marinum TaxID=1631968 RepID=A0AA48HNS5_9ALTE|nr:cytosine-specific methyltransferase [Planctobacterium marinum]